MLQAPNSLAEPLANKDIAIKYSFLTLLLFSFFFFCLSKKGYIYDLDYWSRWSEYIFKNGLGNAYNWEDINYLPIYLYVLFLYGKIQGSVAEIQANVHYLKLFSIFFHFVNGFVLLHLLKKYFHSVEQLLFNALFYLLNIAVLYNAYMWGQVDGIMTCFIFISFYFAYKKYISLSLIFLVLAVNFKLQNIIFFPFIGMLLFPIMLKQFSVKRLIAWISLPILIQIIVLLPFIIAGTTGQLWTVITGSLGKYPQVSLNAYNLWHLLLDGVLWQISDTVTFLGISYKAWGLLAFCTSSFFALFPLFKKGCQQVFKGHQDEFPLEKLLLIGALIPLLFFYFNTQMHERYSHSFMIFAIGYGILTKNPIPAFLGCLAYLLNMETLLKVLELPNYSTFIFSAVCVSSLYLLTIILLFGYLYDWKVLPRFGKRTPVSS